MALILLNRWSKDLLTIEQCKKMNPKACLKRLIAVPVILLFLLTLNGCLFMMPLMMPFMMGTKHSKSGDKVVDPKVDKALGELVQEGVSALAANHGDYDLILLDQTEVTDNLIPSTLFQQRLLKKLRSRNEWQVLDQSANSSTAQHGSGSSRLQAEGVTALLNSQFYQTGDQLWLALQLVDATSKHLSWSGLYSRSTNVDGNEDSGS
jgi:hypothetical protein